MSDAARTAVIYMSAMGLLLGSACGLSRMATLATGSRPGLVSCDSGPRENITFIMGRDEKGENQYYRNATAYFRSDARESTPQVVTHCTTLLEVRDYLVEHRAENGRPWGIINLVVHGNERTGLSCPARAGAGRTTAETLLAVLRSGGFPPLPDDVADEKSEIRIQACGVGRDRELLRLVGLALGGEERRPVIKASPHFQTYEAEEYHGRVLSCRKALAETWSVNYPAGYKPAEILLAKRLSRRAPGENVNWRDAMSRTAPRFSGDVYSRTFNTPVEWIVTYPADQLPDVGDPIGQEEWLRRQDELAARLEKMGLAPRDFTWHFSVIEGENGEPAVRALGLMTTLCVLREVPDPDDEGCNVAV